MTITSRIGKVLCFAAVVAVGACGGSPAKKKEVKGPAAKGGRGPSGGGPLASPGTRPAADSPFGKAIAYFQAAEKSGWNDDKCDEAADRFEDAGDGKLAEAYFNAGVSWQRCGEYNKAEKLYKKALSIDAGHGPSLANLGEIAYRRGRHQEARGLFTKAIRADSSLQVTAARNNLAWMQYQEIRRTSDPGRRKQLEEEARGNMQRALAIDNDNIVAYTLMALLYMEGSERNKNRLDFAELLLNEGKKRNEKYAPLWNAMGLLKMRKGTVAKALEDFRRAVALAPHFHEARMNIAQIVLSSRNYDEAEQQFRTVLKAEPKNYDAIIGLGVALRGQATVLRSMGQMKEFVAKINESEKMYRHAMGLAKERPDSHYNLGLLYKDYRTNDEDLRKNIANYKRAKQYFNDFLARAPKDDPKRNDAQGHVQDCDKYVVILAQTLQIQGSGGGSR